MTRVSLFYSRIPYLWVSENLGRALKIDEHSTFYQDNQIATEVTNPNGKKV